MNDFCGDKININRFVAISNMIMCYFTYTQLIFFVINQCGEGNRFDEEYHFNILSDKSLRRL